VRLIKGFMGEKIKDLGKIKLKGHEIHVELNYGATKCSEKDIHFQSEVFRFQLYERDYLNFLAKIISSREKMLRMKEGYD
jgi:hypothetical protein